jgi:hypothetical protein
MTGLDAGDLVGAAAQRGLERRLLEWVLGIKTLRENRQPRDEQRQVAGMARGETQDNRGIVVRLRSDEIVPQALNYRWPLFLEQLQ